MNVLSYLGAINEMLIQNLLPWLILLAILSIGKK